MPTLSKPMLFSAPMVRAILEGRKTQTRRIIKPQPTRTINAWNHDVEAGEVVMSHGWPHKISVSNGRNKRDAGELTPKRIECPHPAGSEIWVRETWCPKADENGIMWNEDQSTYQVWYKASDPDVMAMDDGGWVRENADGTDASPWKSPIFMPRWASRITLTVESVRVERLQDISEADAKAESCEVDQTPCDHPRMSCAEIGCLGQTHKSSFCQLWCGINGPGSWSANPWVWVYTFKITDKEQAR